MNIQSGSYEVVQKVLSKFKYWYIQCYQSGWAVFMPIEGAYWFGPVCLTIHLSVRYTCIRSRMVFKFYIKSKQDLFVTSATWICAAEDM